MLAGRRAPASVMPCAAGGRPLSNEAITDATTVVGARCWSKTALVCARSLKPGSAVEGAPLHGGSSARSTPSSTTMTTARACGGGATVTGGSTSAGSPKSTRPPRGACVAASSMAPTAGAKPSRGRSRSTQVALSPPSTWTVRSTSGFLPSRRTRISASPSPPPWRPTAVRRRASCAKRTAQRTERGRAQGERPVGDAGERGAGRDGVALGGRAVDGGALVGDADADPVEVGEGVAVAHAAGEAQRERVQPGIDGERGGAGLGDADLLAVKGEGAERLVVEQDGGGLGAVADGPRGDEDRARGRGARTRAAPCGR